MIPVQNQNDLIPFNLIRYSFNNNLFFRILILFSSAKTELGKFIWRNWKLLKLAWHTSMHLSSLHKLNSYTICLRYGQCLWCLFTVWTMFTIFQASPLQYSPEIFALYHPELWQQYFKSFLRPDIWNLIIPHVALIVDCIGEFSCSPVCTLWDVWASFA